MTGGKLFIDYLVYQHDAVFINQIDAGDYDREQLVEMKIPIKLPYYSSTLKYERYYGEIEIKGNYYNYVMRKVQHDTVYLLCLNNDRKTALTGYEIEHAKFFAADGDAVKTKNTTCHNQLKKEIKSEYFQDHKFFEQQLFLSSQAVAGRSAFEDLPDCFEGKTDIPPEFGRSVIS